MVVPCPLALPKPLFHVLCGHNDFPPTVLMKTGSFASGPCLARRFSRDIGHRLESGTRLSGSHGASQVVDTLTSQTELPCDTSPEVLRRQRNPRQLEL